MKRNFIWKKFDEKFQNEDDGNVIRDGFSAKKLGAQSEYDGTTEIEQRMRRGDETIGDPDERDVVGASNAAIDSGVPFVPRRRRKAKGDLPKIKKI